MMKKILVTLVLFQLVEFKTIKVFDTRMKSIVANGLMVVGRPLKMRRAPFAGLQDILYLRAGTDSCVKG